jgi:hypothetical protein
LQPALPVPAPIRSSLYNIFGKQVTGVLQDLQEEVLRQQASEQ